MTVTVRAYRGGDWEQVCRVYDRARPYEIRAFTPPEAATPMAVEAAKHGFFEGEVVVADEDGAVLGFAVREGAELGWLYVDPRHHHRGVGGRLLEHMRPLLSPEAHLFCVRENAQAFAFYRKHGFVPAAFFPDKVGGFACTVVRLTLPENVCTAEPPRPTEAALRAHGLDPSNPGRAVRDEHGAWHWRLG